MIISIILSEHKLKSFRIGLSGTSLSRNGYDITTKDLCFYLLSTTADLGYARGRARQDAVTKPGSFIIASIEGVFVVEDFVPVYSQAFMTEILYARYTDAAAQRSATQRSCRASIKINCNIAIVSWTNTFLECTLTWKKP